MESEKQELIEKYKPIELIKKWKPVLTYKFEDGKSVPNHAHQECAKELELLEKTYKNNLKYLQELIPFCVWAYKTGIKCGGGIEELLEEHPSLKQSLIDESNKVYDLHTFGQGYIGKKTPKEKIEEYKKHLKLNDNKKIKYKLEVMVDPSEISYTDTHIVITKNTPQGVATFSVPNVEAQFVAEGFKNGTHFESYHTGGWIIKQCEYFPLWKSSVDTSS